MDAKASWFRLGFLRGLVLLCRSVSGGFAVRYHGVYLGYANGLRDTQELQDLNVDPGYVEFIPGQSVARRGWMRVVIVMPAFAEGDEGDPPTIARVVACVEAALAPHMRDGVDQPGSVQSEGHANSRAPQHERQAADGE